MACIDILTDEDLDRLDRAVFDVLENVGILYQSERIRAALKAKGARETPDGRLCLPGEFVREIVEDQRRLGWTPPRAARPRATGEYRIGLGLQIAQFVHDYERRQRRRPTRDDLIEITHFGDVYDECFPVDHVLLVGGSHPMIEPLDALLLLLEHTRRPGRIYPHYAAQIPYLAEIGDIVYGDRNHFLIGGIFMVSPLRMDRRSADLMVEKLRRGLSCSVGSQPVAGASAPVTIAGTIVIGAADILGGWAAARVLGPDGPLSGGVCSGILDMRAGDVSFCAPEAMLQDIGLVELFRRRYGGHVNVAGGPDYTDAKVPGLQAAYEKTFEAMAIATYTGQYHRMGDGLLESGKTFSPIQFLLDKELGTGLWQFSKGIEVNDDTLGLESIREVGCGVSMSHIETGHTLRHFRKALWFPKLLDRKVWQGDEVEHRGQEAMLDRIHVQYREILGRYEPPDVDRKMLDAVRKVVDRARRELMG